MRPELVKMSKFLSLVLRHDPSVIGVELDESGWIDVEELLPAIQRKQPDFSRECLQEVVATNDKRRFVFSSDRSRIRASQGHSLGVDLNLTPSIPPNELFHGTVDRNLSSIQERGLNRGKRDYVHLSPDPETARKVGIRHGRPVVLVIQAARMAASGYTVYRAENGVWLTDAVPASFICFPE
ncbi:MAG: RNA 2'-phosphotransferase [bacterium]|nr:RNA 2'-phosphotransferase [bacterium]